MKTLKYTWLIAISLAVLFACGVLWIALSHNPQGEFYDSEFGINWKGIIALWCVFFAVGFAISEILIWVLILLTCGMMKVVQIIARIINFDKQHANHKIKNDQIDNQ